MNVMLTGSHGYIGTHLRSRLFLPTTCDLKNGQDYRGFYRGRFDAVVHLAAYVSVMDSIERPEAYMDNNCHGVQHFLSNNDVGRFVFISTGGAMYGNRHLAREEDASLEHCLSPYAQSKFEAERMVRLLCPNHVILRLANVYGGDYSVRGEAAAQSHFSQDDPIVVYGGDQTRDFVDIETVAQAIIRAVNGDMVGTYNIGSGVETSVMSVAETHSRERRVAIEVRPARPGEVDFISLDCSKAQKVGLL